MYTSTKLAFAAGSLALLIVTGGGCASSPAPAVEKKEEVKKEAVKKEVVVKKIEAIPGFALYDVSKDWGIKFQAPKDWEKDETIEDGSLLTFFYSPLENSKDGYRDNIGVNIITIPADVELDLKDFADAAHEGLKKSIGDFITVDNGEVTVAGVTARQYTYTGTLNVEGAAKIKIKAQEHFLVKNGKAYNFGFAAGLTSYDKYLLTAEKIMSSIEFAK